MKDIVTAGATSNIYLIRIQDSSSTTNAGFTGLGPGTGGLTWYYKRSDMAASTAVTPATITTLGTFVSGGIKEVDGTNMKGVYEVHPPNAAFTSGKDCVMHLQGVTNMSPVTFEFSLKTFDLQTATQAVTSNIKKASPLAKFQFLMTDNTNHAPATGKSVTCLRSIDGGAYGAGTLANVAEVGNGTYTVDFGTGDLNGNVIMLQATATNCDTRFERIITQP